MSNMLEKIKNKQLFLVCDTECYKNFFLAVFKDVKTKEFYIFEYSIWKNDMPDMIKFLKSNRIFLIGYNLQYDTNMLYHVYKNLNKPVESYKKYSDNYINSKQKYPGYAPWEIKQLIPTAIDTMIINNYGITSAKTTSLKTLQFNFRTSNIQDLPIHHTKAINTLSNRDAVVKYCIHDVDETEKHFEISKPLIKYRRLYGEIENLYLLDCSETQLAKKVVTKKLSEKMGISEENFLSLRTYRDKIVVKDIIVPLEFDMSINKKLLEFYQSKVLTATVQSKLNPDKLVISLRNSISYSIEYPNGLICNYGAGGLHGVVPPNIFIADDNTTLRDFDFGSFYPHWLSLYKFKPNHIPDGILEELIMTWYNERTSKYPKKTHWDINYAIKIIINLIYGLMGSEFYALYDVLPQLAICVNGMLHLSKMIELCFINGGEVIYANTDGFVLKCSKDKIDNIEKQLYEYAEHLKIPLEAEEFAALYLEDVNSFLAVYKNGSLKEKGRFETYETITSHNDYHKDTSSGIVAKSLVNYFINNVPIEDTVYNCNDIFEFAIGTKGSSRFDLIEHEEGGLTFIENKSNDEDGNWIYNLVLQTVNNDIVTNKVHDVRMLRYYASTEGSTLSKFWVKKGSALPSFESVEANTTVKLIQNITKKEIYDLYKDGSYKINYDSNNKIKHRYPNINFDYYINKAQEIVDKIEQNQII